MSSKSRNSCRLYQILVVIDLVGVVLAMRAYGEPFRFWQYPISALGATVTVGGADNLSAMHIYMGMLAISSICLWGVTVLQLSDVDADSLLMKFLPALGATGFLISMAPHNEYHLVHSIGSGMVVGSLYVTATILLHRASSYLGLVRDLIETALHISVLSYAVLYFVDVPLKQAIQKPAVLFLWGSVAFAVAVLAENREPLGIRSRERLGNRGAIDQREPLGIRSRETPGARSRAGRIDEAGDVL